MTYYIWKIWSLDGSRILSAHAYCEFCWKEKIAKEYQIDTDKNKSLSKSEGKPDDYCEECRPMPV